MVEMESAHQHRYTAKFSHEKNTLPGAKQIFRHGDHDVLARSTECISCGGETAEALQRPVILGGKLVEPLPTAAQAKRYAAERMARLPAPCHSLFQVENAWRVELSPALKELDESVRKEHAG
jgi:nicotinate phosphoribosyltransferase